MYQKCDNIDTNSFKPDISTIGQDDGGETITHINKFVAAVLHIVASSFFVAYSEQDHALPSLVLHDPAKHWKMQTQPLKYRSPLLLRCMPLSLASRQAVPQPPPGPSSEDTNGICTSVQLLQIVLDVQNIRPSHRQRVICPNDARYPSGVHNTRQRWSAISTVALKSQLTRRCSPYTYGYETLLSKLTKSRILSSDRRHRLADGHSSCRKMLALKPS